MTKNEFIEKYGDVEVQFSSYYKYSFTFTAKLPDGKDLAVGFGGNADDIYKTQVVNNQVSKVKDLWVSWGGVYEKSKEIEGFYDY